MFLFKFFLQAAGLGGGVGRSLSRTVVRSPLFHFESQNWTVRSFESVKIRKELYEYSSLVESSLFYLFHQRDREKTYKALSYQIWFKHEGKMNNYVKVKSGYRRNNRFKFKFSLIFNRNDERTILPSAFAHNTHLSIPYPLRVWGGPEPIPGDIVRETFYILQGQHITIRALTVIPIHTV